MRQTFKRHRCILSEETGEYERLPKYASWRQKLKRALQLSVLMSYNHASAQLYYRTNTAVAAARKQHAHSSYSYIIHPFSPFRLNWELFMVVVLLMFLVVVPLDFTYDRFTPEIGLRLMTLVLDFTCMGDIAMTFFTGYTVDHLKQVILRPHKILMYANNMRDCYSMQLLYHYFMNMITIFYSIVMGMPKGKYLLSLDFFLDIVSAFPMNMLIMLINMATHTNTAGFLIPYAIIKVYKIKTLLTYMRRGSEYWQLSRWFLLYLRYIILILLTIHWWGCMQFFVPTYLNDFYEIPIDRNSWIERRQLEKMNYIELYFEATFKATGHLFCIRNPMYSRETIQDHLVYLIVGSFGYLATGLGLVVFIQVILRLHTSKIKYNSVMNQLCQYMRHKQLPIVMQNRLIDYYEFWLRKSYFRESDITSILSDRVRGRINMYVCSTLIKKVPILMNLPEAIIINIVSNLKAEVFLPTDIIVKAATKGDCMYFIYSGTVAVYTPTGKEVCHLQDGAYFGEMSLIEKDQRRIATVVAIEMTEVYRLDRRCFNSYVKVIPELYKKFERTASRRLENTQVMEEIHRKHILEKTMRMRYDKDIS